MKNHWTERSIKDFLFSITSDFVSQLEKKMEAEKTSQNKFAKRLGLSKGRISQIINNPGNITLLKAIEYARALGMKVSLVAYEDGDPENKKGPINSEIFKISWEKANKPRDFWAFQEVTVNKPDNLNFLSPDYPYYYHFSSALASGIGTIKDMNIIVQEGYYTQKDSASTDQGKTKSQYELASNT